MIHLICFSMIALPIAYALCEIFTPDEDFDDKEEGQENG